VQTRPVLRARQARVRGSIQLKLEAGRADDDSDCEIRHAFSPSCKRPMRGAMRRARTSATVGGRAWLRDALLEVRAMIDYGKVVFHAFGSYFYRFLALGSASCLATTHAEARAPWSSRPDLLDRRPWKKRAASQALAQQCA